MSNRRIVIVGGVAGGATAAARLRRVDEQAEIILLERGEHVSFANCGLPYHVGGTIPTRQSLLLQTPESLHRRFRIDVRVRQEVIRIHREARELEVRDLTTGNTYSLSYDHLILSTGAAPVRPPLPGADLPGIFTLRSIPDMDRIIAAAEAHPRGRAAVIGGGFIGLEMAENLRHRGLAVTLIEMLDQVMPNLDREMAALVHHHLRSQGVDLRLQEGVSAFASREGGLTVRLRSGAEVPVDLAVLSVGVRPETRLAAEAGLALGKRGGVLVDEKLLTSDPDISAIGDVAEVPAFDGGTTWVPLAGPANRQGRLVADRLGGLPIRYTGIQGTGIAKIFDLTVGFTGKNEAALRREGVPFHSIVTLSNSHAAYYPGATPITMKLHFGPDGAILGAQAVGLSGVDKRVDVLATAMRLGAKVDDLAALELAYAPPYSSAKDPVNILGYVAGNVLRGAKMVDWRQVMERNPATTALLDVREEAERQTDLIEGSIHIPLDQLRDRLAELPRDKEIIVYCAVGQRAHTAVRILAQNGFRVANLTGGMRLYGPIRDDLKAARNQHPPMTGGETSTQETSTQETGTQETHTQGTFTREPGVPETAKAEAPAEQSRVVQVDACGLQCPGPIMQVYKAIKAVDPGDVLAVSATDPAFPSDIQAWCQRTGNQLLATARDGSRYMATVRKGTPAQAPGRSAAANLSPEAATDRQDKTMVVFSNDLDRAIASFIIANGAAAMGRQVTMFFTFWGLNILRRPEPVPVAKGFLDRMFSGMMPRGTRRLGLSKMNMLGMGPRMIRHVMKVKGVTELEGLIQQARTAGVRLVACQMSMEIMGIRQEELIDGVEIGGVASYLAAAEESNVNLFI